MPKARGRPAGATFRRRSPRRSREVSTVDIGRARLRERRHVIETVARGFKLIRTTPPDLTVEIVSRALGGAAFEPLSDLVDGAPLALARCAAGGKLREREVEVLIGPANPALNEQVRVTCLRGIDEVCGNVNDEVVICEVGGKSSTELAGVDFGMEEVVGGGSAERLVGQAELAVGHVEVVEIAAFAPLRERTELRGDQLDRLEGE